MIRDRPLTCLFLAATLVLDLVLLATKVAANGNGWPIGFVLGQAAVVSFWSVHGQAHRLARGAWLIVAVGLLLFLTTQFVPDSPLQMLAFFSCYVFILVVATLLISILRFLLAGQSVSDIAKEHRQIALIELFGWTILVAIVSLGGQHMDFSFLGSGIGAALKLAALLVVPLSFTAFVKTDLRDLNSVTAFLIVAAVCGTGYYWMTVAPSARLIPTQAAYLVAWFLVRGFDNITCEASSVKTIAD